MDFIERVFDVAPDGGSGLFELMLFVLPALVACARWRRARRSLRCLQGHRPT